MATLPGAQITIGDIVDDAYNLLKSTVNNIDTYTGNATDSAFTARTQTLTGEVHGQTGGRGEGGYASASLTLTFTGKPPIVSTANFKSAWDSWISDIGFASKRNQLVTIKTLVQFLTYLSMYAASRFVVVTNPINQKTARFFVANSVPSLSSISEMEPIRSSDISTMLSNIKRTITSYEAEACNVSWGTLNVASCCSSSSSSSSSSYSSSSSSSSMYIAYYQLV